MASVFILGFCNDDLPIEIKQSTVNPAIVNFMSSALMGNYARQAIGFTHGQGSWLYDAQNKAYLDGLSGISVTNLGHNHPAITRVIQEQASTLLHTSNIFPIEWQSKLAEALAEQAVPVAMGDSDTANTIANSTANPAYQVFFGNSGTEANEAAVKLTKLHAHNQGNTSPLIITFSGSFHGRTMGMIAATAGEKIKAGFNPQLPGFLHLPFNDVSALEAAFAEHHHIAAVMLEPVQGEGGINLASIEFLNAIQRLCKQTLQDQQALVILDEVQSGNARCGEYFAFNRFRKDGSTIDPDIITTAKGLGNGLPIGACIAKTAIAQAFAPGKHGSTFGGNPLCCRVGHEVVQQIQIHQLANRAKVLGEQLYTAFSDALANYASLKTIRHKGLMIGIELVIAKPNN